MFYLPSFNLKYFIFSVIDCLILFFIIIVLKVILSSSLCIFFYILFNLFIVGTLKPVSIKNTNIFEQFLLFTDFTINSIFNLEPVGFCFKNLDFVFSMILVTAVRLVVGRGQALGPLFLLQEGSICFSGIACIIY